jgi:hypothetical protein
LENEVERIIDSLPTITPAQYNNHAIEMEFVLPIKIPLTDNVEESTTLIPPPRKLPEPEPLLTASAKTMFPEHKSELNIPLVHSVYDSYDYYLNKGSNAHTSIKPYMYTDVTPYVNLDSLKSVYMKPRKTWFGRKLWNEHLVNVQGENFWITLDIPVDLQVGYDSEGAMSTFNNTRALQINGGIGKKFSYSTTFYESQGRFAQYFNEYAELIKPDGGNPAIIPGRGIAKEYNSDAYDYPVAEAYLSFTANKYFNFQFGNGKNFIGDGYRSLLLSDVASPYPYFKINTSFWKIKFTNIWLWGQDVRPELTVDGAYKQKFMAVHYLSWNVTKNFNLGLFETVIWDNANENSFNVSYLNPIIFYTAAEFQSGSRAGNVLLGMNLKYKFKDIALYGQLVLDEFRLSEMTSDSGWWANKFGYQIGAKFFNPFKVENLYFQVEYNSVRPYTYSHDELNYNFGTNNQPLAHLWGANFREFVGIARFTHKLWYADAKFVIGTKGFDYNTDGNYYSYGGDIYRDNDDRVTDYDNSIGQGNTTNVFVGNLQVGYVINPTTNLKLFSALNYRHFSPTTNTPIIYNSNSTWISVGLKTDVFNWYFDF